jgi:hypothetical protein
MNKVLRICNNNLKSRNGFKYKKKGMVYCRDFLKNGCCGNGLHGFLNFKGCPDLIVNIYGLRKYLLIDVEDKDLDVMQTKCKFGKGNVVECHNNLIDLIENNLSLLESLKTKNKLAFEFTKNAISEHGVFAYSYFGNAKTINDESIAISRVGEATAFGTNSWADGFTRANISDWGFARVRKMGGVINVDHNNKKYIVDNKKYKVGVWYKYSHNKKDLVKVK